MKTPLLMLSAACGALSGAAQASVTLYGVTDANIEYVNHLSPKLPTQPGFPGPGETRMGLTSGGLSGSRWGLRGTEDLDGGLKALFVLENGFGLDDGKATQSGRLFGRQAFVGLQSDRVGRMTFGRQYTAIFDAFSNFSPSGYSTQYEPIAAQLGLDFRSDNMAKYTGTFGALTAIADWSFGNGVFGNGETPGQFRRDTGYGMGLNYFSGAFGLAFAFNRYDPTIPTSGGVGNFRKAGVAASYSTGPVKLMAGYRWGLNKGGNGATIVRDDYYWAGINYQPTGALGLTLGYYYDDVKALGGANVPNPWQVSFIADYNLSKRTDIYLTMAYVRNAGINFDTSAVSFANGYFLGADHSTMTAIAVGIRHKF
ncbi:Outer membrane porin protein [Cupriavidus yeoncheonensis]|uniref:Outer membrane porin protein n=1 Tax=Cupriavidus yeoncheonensis TaxID=1462994 RepID=A0A916IUY5_9BURK|nr:porin [Cupriavidus yeoncheonensis]CAG2142341.1 Outer membrane porin protein [Cupriavidus yeoncheonensis]